MNWKKIAYVGLTMALGVILSAMAHAGVEYWYIGKMTPREILLLPQSVFGLGLCFLPKYLQVLLPILGLIGGYFLGIFWWRNVYENADKRIDQD